MNVKKELVLFYFVQFYFSLSQFFCVDLIIFFFNQSVNLLGLSIINLSGFLKEKFLKKNLISSDTLKNSLLYLRFKSLILGAFFIFANEPLFSSIMNQFQIPFFSLKLVFVNNLIFLCFKVC